MNRAAIYTLKLLVGEFFKLKQNGFGGYFSDKSNVLDLVMICMCISVFVIQLQARATLELLHYPTSPPPDPGSGFRPTGAAPKALVFSAARMVFIDNVRELVRLSKTGNSLAAMATLIMSIRVLKLFSPFPKLRILAGTLEVALPALGWFCIVFFMLFFAWCAAGVILFGNVIPEFKTFGTAIIHLKHLLLLGKNSYDAMAAESLTAALVFFWSFLLLLSSDGGGEPHGSAGLLLVLSPVAQHCAGDRHRQLRGGEGCDLRAARAGA